MGRGRAPCCDKSQVKRGPWSPAEDLRLVSFIQKNGHENWRALPKQAGLLRCGKSCRLRWINYLRPDVKRGNFTKEEEETIIMLHETLGNKWSKIASHLPGRTDNEIKNVWNTHLKKRLSAKSVAPDGHEAKESSATSSTSSSSSSSTIMSCDDQGNHGSIVKKPRVLVNSQGSRPSMEVKGLAGSICMSSNNSNARKFSQLDVSQNPENSMGSVLNFTGPNYGSLRTALEEVSKPVKDEIPLESDYDFWEMLDNLSAFQSTNKFQLNNVTVGGPLACGYGEAENKKWMLYLETEHGVEATKDGEKGNQPDNVAAPPVPEKLLREKLPFKPVQK